MLNFASTRNLCGVTLAALFLAAPAASQAQSGYTLVDLGTLGGTYSAGLGINNSGQVAGYVNETGGIVQHAVRWTGTSATDLGTLGGTISGGSSINASGQVTGISTLADDSTRHAVVWTGTTAADLGALGGTTSGGNGINDGGQVAGYSKTAGNAATHAVVWTGTAIIDLGTMGGTNSMAYGINNSEQVTGYAQMTGNTTQYAFRYSGGTMTNLGGLSGTYSTGAAINDSGQIAGNAQTTGNGGAHAVRWTGTTITDLGTLGGTTSAAYGINASGDVVGASITARGSLAAFLYSDGRMVDLNTFRPSGSNWFLEFAYGINDNGWITGSGAINGIEHAYILRPNAVPEPSTFAVFGFGALAIGAGMRRRRRKGGVGYTETSHSTIRGGTRFMAYSQFTMAQLQAEYHLENTGQAALFADAPPAVISDWLRETLRKQTVVALQSGSEKARSEYLIAPILIEVYEQMRERVNLFSGVEFDVDEARGLAGFCDFLFTLAPRAINIQAPVVYVVEAKKEDILKGIPQCLAELIAAQIFNARADRPIETLYGVVTNGEVWKFLRLQGTHAIIDTDDYFLNQPEKIVGIILSMLR